jgi:alpha-tubulin suppressor-like RCC1 family protein
LRCDPGRAGLLLGHQRRRPRRRHDSPPAAVDLTLHLVTASSSFSCGVTTGDRAYCWGNNFYRQVGDGTTSDRLIPVAVAGAM